ncbi:uncharacterized protein LOC129726856 [Wyeomyia smithii]|uniref:uncharacterized protein LOC129726856 n=1 Tax=Wyeomyia smithii TaxID=174621 RepID=UPI002467EAF5|nr:uncharacterized protein LOC129726856 [Wyeomyia smithii]
MKCLIGFTLLMLISISNAGKISREWNEKMDLNDILKNLIEQFKELMPCGFPDLGVPPLVPFELNHTAFDFEQKGLLHLDAEINDLLVDNLNVFDVVNIDLKLLQIQLDFSFYFEAIQTTGTYKAKGSAIGFIPFNRGGKFAFNFNGLTLDGSIKVAIDGEKISVTDFKLNPTVESVNSKFEGVFILPLNTFIFNKIVEAVVPNFLTDNKEQVASFLEDMIKPQVNDLLDDYTLQDLIDFIGNAISPGQARIC